MTENKITPEIVTEAWALRKRALWTMREIAEKLDVNREDLIEAMRKEGKDD